MFGLLFTFLVPESKGKSLEEMSKEDQVEEEHEESKEQVNGVEQV